jgi:hypothetical protein
VVPDPAATTSGAAAFPAGSAPRSD